MKNGYAVADDEDDDAARTNVSKDQVNVTLSTEELFLITQYKYIALPHNRKVRHQGEGYRRST
jgi:hypothetical protein